MATMARIREDTQGKILVFTFGLYGNTGMLIHMKDSRVINSFSPNLFQQTTENAARLLAGAMRKARSHKVASGGFWYFNVFKIKYL